MRAFRRKFRRTVTRNIANRLRRKLKHSNRKPPRRGNQFYLRFSKRGEVTVMSGRKRSLVSKLSLGIGLVLGLIMIATSAALASNPRFAVPEDTALRIRLDDTLTSVDSQAGDPFSATVVDEGEYRNARVYGHVTQIEMSGKVKGSTSM